MEQINAGDGSLDKFSTAYQSFGLIINESNDVIAREWAPGAKQLFLTGDFSKWHYEV